MTESKNITVLHLVHRYTVGGAEAVINYLCRFSPPTITNIVCSFHDPDEHGLATYGQDAEILCLDKRPGNDFRAVLRLGKIIRDKCVDLVHAQGWGTYIEGLFAAKLLAWGRKPLVYAFHGKTINDVKNGIPGRRRIIQKAASLFTDAIIAPSSQMAGDYASTIGLAPDKVNVIYNGIDLSRYQQSYPGAKQELGLGPSDFVIGFVGRLDPVKNLYGLLKVFSLVLDMLGENELALRLILVGDGPELSGLKDKARQMNIHDHVLFLGMRQDIPLCLSAMDVYIQPSFYEGHSNTLLEAMTSGLPVISTKVGGTPEIIAHGKTGLLFEPDNYEGMANAVFSLLKDSARREALADAGRQLVMEKFSVQTMVKAYSDLFYSLSA